mmetsp:Transcript_62872/g.99795  ORF Transcript_62872/g.99795 Transcript_62872/m.99795 type:complete len:225 (+) Transcript_62872:76-750(+)|eukprot:CAMPEP_0169117738 /NCGR_PEP_ID=MMETSP1015-20121227/30624_1 /TAXON_ID=342587 /ORGANISM="Karlodinium micrum, Strain CCMP2283" /LENGTH=224 /DNA_ID=CAMNT_0009180453 /DNA_START=71 /DNA_END=745 /DNA_ORIENTATION=-
MSNDVTPFLVTFWMISWRVLATNLERKDREALGLSIDSRGHLDSGAIGKPSAAEIVAEQREQLTSLMRHETMPSEAEPTVYCGGGAHAPTCGACPLGYGQNRCKGDCEWEWTLGICRMSHQPVYFEDKTSPPYTAVSTTHNSQSSNDVAPLTVNKQTQEIRHQQAVKEAQEDQAEEDLQKFYQVTLMSMAGTAVIIACLACCICICCCRSKKKKPDPLIGAQQT